jgi:hypothetical protein
MKSPPEAKIDCDLLWSGKDKEHLVLLFGGFGVEVLK